MQHFIRGKKYSVMSLSACSAWVDLVLSISRFTKPWNIRSLSREYLPKGLARRVEGGRVEPVSPSAAEPFQQSLLKFRKECEALLMLEHPNIVYVYDCFFALGTAYLVMHREVGCTLWERFASQMQTEQSPISWAQLSASLPGILAGLEYIHSRRLVHRDIKPGNIFLRDGMFASPLLIDFGAVKFTGGFVSRYAQNTPIYAALEQEYDLFSYRALDRYSCTGYHND